MPRYYFKYANIQFIAIKIHTFLHILHFYICPLAHSAFLALFPPSPPKNANNLRCPIGVGRDKEEGSAWYHTVIAGLTGNLLTGNLVR